MDFTKQSPVILSLCPGIRGLERGLERVFQSIRVAAYVEIETFIVENLLTAMEAGLVDAAPVWTNLKTFNPEPFRDRIDGIIGGYPCQPFSVAGKGKGSEDPRHLYPYIESAIRTIRPVWCFFENVEGHLSLGYEEVYRSLRNLGYRVESGIYSAEEIGSTHERNRLFILAILADPNGNDRKRGFADVLQKTTKGKAKTREQFGEWDRNVFKSCGEVVGHSDSAGLSVSICREKQSVHKKAIPYSRSEFSGTNPENFPLGQGPLQWEWEEPRTIESSLVYTVNGYNFTEDLHRAIGNSVVEQTAELAFRDLLSKHFQAIQHYS